MPFSGDTFTHLFDWEKDPQRQEKIINARLEAEFDGVDTGLSAQAARITTLSPASGQIAFPATQNPSANANTLDDYEEGTWTPVLTFATPGNLVVNYSIQDGAYTKIGRLVVVSFRATTSTFTHTTAAGACLITGLPFSASNALGVGGGFFQGITKANYAQVVARAGFSGATTLDFLISAPGQPNNQLVFSDMPTGGTVDFSFTVTYFAS